jgi:tetratricopeptide (TPR) repeat protein
MARTLCLVLLLLAFSFPISSQTTVDSLKKLVSSLPDNEQKADALNELAWSILFNNPQEGELYINQALELSKALKYKKGQAQAFNELGALASTKGDSKAALNNYFLSLKLKEELKDERGIGIGYINIGMIYSDQQQYKEADVYFRKALDAFLKIKNEKEIAATYNSIGSLFEEQKIHDSAIYYMEKGLEIRKRINDEDGLTESYGNLGVVYRKLGDLKKALVYYKLDHVQNQKAGNLYNLTVSMNNLSILHFQMGNHEEAIKLALKSAEISDKNHYLQNLKYSLGNLAQFYSETGNYKEAYNCIGKWADLKDTLKNVELSRTLNDLSIKYETEKKEQQNILLTAQNELSAKTIKQQKLIVYFIILALVLALGLAYFIFRGLKQQRYANSIISAQKKEVEIQKHQIEEHRKEVLDSIHYAKRIQKAHLPSDNYISKTFRRLKKDQ